MRLGGRDAAVLQGLFGEGVFRGFCGMPRHRVPQRRSALVSPLHKPNLRRPPQTRLFRAASDCIPRTAVAAAVSGQLTAVGGDTFFGFWPRASVVTVVLSVS